MMYFIKNAINSWILLFLFFALCPGQEQGNFFIRNYTSEEIKAIGWNELIFQDNRGVLYVGNQAGAVLEYDGANWRNIPVNESHFRMGTVVVIASDSIGRIYIGSSGDFGFLEPDIQGRMVYHSLVKMIKAEDSGFNDIFNIEIVGGDVYFRSIERLFRLRDGKVTAFRNPYGWFGEIFTLRNQLYVTIDYKGIILRMQDDSLVKILEDNRFTNTRFSYSAEYAEHKRLIGNDKGLFLFSEGSTNEMKEYRLERFYTEVDNEIIGTPSRVYRIGKQKYIIGTWNTGIFIIDNHGKIISRINKQSGLSSSRINHLYLDDHQSLWVTTNIGISRADFSQPFSFWNNFSGDPYVVLKVLRHNGRIYFDSAAKGLYCLRDNRVDFIDAYLFNPTIYTEPANRARSHLLVFSNNAMFEIINNKPVKCISYPKLFYFFDIIISKLYPDRIFIAGTDGLYALRFNQGKWMWEGNVEGVQNNIQFISEDHQGNLWLTLNNQKGLIRLEPDKQSKNGTHPALKYRKELLNPPELDSATWIRGFSYKNRLLFGTDKGLWNYDETTGRFLPDSSLGKKFCDGSRGVYLLQEGPKGEIFISGLHHHFGNIGVCFPLSNSSFKWYTRPFNYLPRKLGISNAFIDLDGTVWLATDEGLIKYDPVMDKGLPGQFNTLIRKVSTDNDSILFHGTYYKEVPDIDRVTTIKVTSLKQPEFMKPVLSYRFNSIKFTFSAVSFIREEQNSYTYMLEGFDREWSSWTSQNTKEYTNLPEGRYTFHVKGKNVFGTVSNEATYAFTILPPWYRTLWAYAGFALLAILLVYLIVMFTVKRLKASNVLLENTVQLRTREISQKNNQLEQQKEEIETTLENLQRTQEQLIESEKMAALGGLVAGIAHEINTPVGIGVTAVSNLHEEIQKMASMFKKDEINRREFKEFLESANDATMLIQKNLERTASLIQSFKQVSVDQVSEKQRSFNLKAYLHDIIHSLTPKYRNHDIAISLDCDEKLELNSFPGVFAQIFTNLLMNSCTHGFHDCEKGSITIRIIPENQSLRIEYRDNGQGISKKDLPHIFEPFYTSDQRRGTGLGLNIVYNLVKQKLQGNISCESEPGKGVLFTLTLPL
jgi:signal transduction histidine kinase